MLNQLKGPGAEKYKPKGCGIIKNKGKCLENVV